MSQRHIHHDRSGLAQPVGLAQTVRLAQPVRLTESERREIDSVRDPVEIARLIAEARARRARGDTADSEAIAEAAMHARMFGAWKVTR